MATAFDALFAHYGDFYGVPVDVIEGVARTESHLNPAAIGDNGRSWGLFQIYEPTARQYGFRGNMRELLDPAKNTELAVRYMRAIIDDQGELDLRNFYSEYNSGNPTLWQRSEDVAEHVENFLENYQLAAGTAGVGIVLAIAVFWIWRSSKRGSH